MKFFSICDNMDVATTWTTLEGVKLSEISQIDKDKNTVWYHLYVVLKNTTN